MGEDAAVPKTDAPKTVLTHKSKGTVRKITLGDEKTAACYLSSLYIPIIDTNTATVVKTYETSTHMAGIHFSDRNKKVLYSVDDSFGLHVFDTRSDSKQKRRMNPEVENHTVNCTAFSENIVAVASSMFGSGISDVRCSRKKEVYSHVVTLFDIRNCNSPLTYWPKRSKDEITMMQFSPNGHDLLIGDRGGYLRSCNTQRLDEDNALRWEKWVKGTVTTVGFVNKRIAYSVSDNTDINVFIDSKSNPIEVLFGSVGNSADNRPTKASPSTYPDPKYTVGLVKGKNDILPLVAIWGKKDDSLIRLTPMDQVGHSFKKTYYEYEGHKQITSFATDNIRLLTGDEEGQILIKDVRFMKDEKDKKRKPEKGSSDEKKIKKKKEDEDDSNGSGPSTSGSKTSSSKEKSKKSSEKSTKSK